MQRLIGKCGPCGGFLGIHAIFVDDHNRLVLEGQCMDCMERIVSSITLTELYKMSMEQRKGKPLIPPMKEKVEGVEHTDTEWFKIFGIKEDT